MSPRLRPVWGTPAPYIWIGTFPICPPWFTSCWEQIPKEQHTRETKNFNSFTKLHQFLRFKLCKGDADSLPLPRRKWHTSHTMRFPGSGGVRGESSISSRGTEPWIRLRQPGGFKWLVAGDRIVMEVTENTRTLPLQTPTHHFLLNRQSWSHECKSNHRNNDLNIFSVAEICELNVAELKTQDCRV